MNTVEENSNTNERPVVDPDEIAIDDINRQFIPLSQHESYDDDTDDPKRRVKMKVFRPPCKEKINAFYILWFYYLNPINKTKVADFMNIGSSVKLQVLNHLYTGQKNYRNENHQYGFGAHLLQSYYLKIASYPTILPIGVTTKTALRRKFDSLKYYLHNPYITETHRNDILSIFCCIQKLYHWINRCVFYRKWKKSTVVVNTDLAFNELDPENRNVFVLYQQNKRFYFNIQELLRVIRNALSQEYEDNYTVISHFPKNPYNNVFLSNCDLYNFYFHLKYNVCGVIPIFYELWFLEQFDLTQYTHKYEFLLKRMCIQNHVRYSNNFNRRMQSDVVGMLEEYKTVCPWVIDNKFPASMLVQTFRPYLYLYYLFHYEALEYGIMDQYENILYAKLKEAYTKYPLYGTRKAAVQKYGELPKSAFAIDDNNQISIVPKEPEPEPEPEPSSTHDSTVDSSSEISTIPISTTSSNSNSSSDLDNPVLDSVPEPELSHVDDSLSPTIGSVASFVASNITQNNGYSANDDDIHDWLRRFLEIGPEIWTSPSQSSTVNRSMLYRASARSSRSHNTSIRTSTRTTNTTNNTNEKITEYNVSDIFYTECLVFNSWNIY